MQNEIGGMIKEMDEIVAEGKISIDKESGVFLVENLSENTFEVYQTSDGWHCSCEFYQNKGICQHILAVSIASHGNKIEETRSSFTMGRSRRRNGRRMPRRRYAGGDSRQRRDRRRRPDRRSRNQRDRRR